MCKVSMNGKSCRRGVRSALAARVGTFAREEDGVFLIISLYAFIFFMIIGGLAMDFMHHEYTRVRLQNTLDRAVLAASDLDQPRNPVEVVHDYFRKSGLDEYLNSVTVEEGLNYRTVSAEAYSQVDTIFLGIAGIETLPAHTAGAAEERVANVEISLVIDISGSMGWNGKIQNLRAAGAEFVDTVLKEQTQDLISISLVPYTAHVNAGPWIYSYLNVSTPTDPDLELPENISHVYSHCVEFEQSDFEDTTISLTKAYRQGQHFAWSSSSQRWIVNPGCPRAPYEQIMVHSQNATTLKNTIASYNARANTSIHIGMKWGAALVDPSFRPILSGMISSNQADSTFAGRPAGYDDPETLKTIVVMTDGENVDTYRIADWAYDSPNEWAHWDRYNLWHWLYKIPSSQRGDFYYRKYTSSQADAMLDSVCDAAKDQGVVVWAIGFEVGTRGANVMRNCASTPSHFFRVEGGEISDAFKAIARQINQLRLTL